MENMDNFFEAILGYFTQIAEKIIGNAIEQRRKNKKYANINDKGENIPKNVHDKMAYNNMDISNEWARKWSKADLDKYTKEWNALPEEVKQARRDKFHDDNIDAIEYAAKEYYKDTHKKLRHIDTYFKQDRENQPIYQQRLKEKEQSNNGNGPSDTKKQDEVKPEQKQDKLEENLSKQSSTERQKDEIQNDHLSGKPSVEIGNQQMEETRTQGVQRNKPELNAESRKSLNKEILGLQPESNEVDLFSGADTAKKEKELAAQKQHKQELEMQSEANSKDLFGPGKEASKNQKKELEQKPEKNNTDLFDKDSPEYEKFKEKVEKGAQKRKDAAAKNTAAQKSAEATQVKDNNVAMVPNSK
jgi:hypothetical protein